MEILIKQKKESLIKEINKCKCCRLWQTRKNIILGEGDLNSRIMLIAQAPGEKEDKENKMFIGPSGDVLRKLLDNANISWNEIYITNLIKCILPKCRKPKQDEIEKCSKYLEEEIEIVNPTTLVPLGYYATKYIFQKYSLPEFSKKEFQNIVGKLNYVSGKNIYPLTHPSALLYNNDYEKKTTRNYQKLKILLYVCKWYEVCPMKYYYEMGRLEEKWISLYCKGDWESCIRYKMEESGKYHPDNMLPDGSIDNNL